jgi:pyridoxal phosphate enzyme (YggS family)
MSNDEQQLADDASRIAANYRSIRARADAAAVRAGRDPGDVTVIGVTKTKPAAMIRHAAQAGILDVGENYVQEITAKHEEIGDLVRWHFIGHLQRNKVRFIAPFAMMIHSVDSESLGVEIDRQAKAHQRRIPVLLEVNTSGEESKFGVPPEAAPDLARGLAALPNIELRGLMTIVAFLDDAEMVRPMFRLLRELRDACANTLGIELPTLSMGMTHDFEVAIEEGATLVRIGTAIFGER